jgi:hypothetical protein
MWGAAPEGFPYIGPAHPPSPYDGLHPYLFMLGALYVAFGILLIRGANDPRRNVALFDFGILSSILHGLVMVPQSFIYPSCRFVDLASEPGKRTVLMTQTIP